MNAQQIKVGIYIKICSFYESFSLEKLTVRNDKDKKFDKSIHHNGEPRDKQDSYNDCDLQICQENFEIEPDGGSITPPPCEHLSWSGMLVKLWI